MLSVSWVAGADKNKAMQGEAGADKDRAQKDGMTPLHIAALEGHLEEDLVQGRGRQGPGG